MHLLGAIYTWFYGSFMKAFQVSNGVKRVNGNPVKSGFQCHKQFAVKLYNACKWFMLRIYCKSLDVGALIWMVFDTNVDRLHWILSEYQAHHTSWDVLDNKPSQLIALCMKSMRSYLQCKHAISAQDRWHLEIESCNLLPIWKMTRKSTYFRLQCEFMELFYNQT